jgi:four helix bundle protein
MKKVTKFEDLIAWQKARELTREIYSITTIGKFEKDFGLKSQIQRACVSIMSNIAEGFDRAGRAEFHQYLVVAKGSCAEVRSQLYVAYDIGYLSNEQFDKLKKITLEVSQIIGGLRSAVKKQKDEQK